MTYFAIIGKHKRLSGEELQRCQPTAFRQYGPLVVFDTVHPERIRQLGGIIKRGIVIERSDLKTHLTPWSLVGLNEESIGKTLKSEYQVKRYKFVDPLHCDREVTKEGSEIYVLPEHHPEYKTHIGLIQWYQSIDLYEAIDINKPLSGMTIGMMPSKLAHMLINIALAQTPDVQDPTIFDPFCGFGTTNFIANALGYHTIWSDKTITSAKQNRTRRDTQSFKTDHRVLITKHDVTQPFGDKVFQHATHIVTEGRLGPIITQRVGESMARDNQLRILEVYEKFVTHVAQAREHIVIVMTVPHYMDNTTNILSRKLTEIWSSSWFEVSTLSEIYSRPNQKVGRQVMVMKK